jgi:integrase
MNPSLNHGQERILHILLAATGMRISEALALKSGDFINDCRTVVVRRQVEKDCPRIVGTLKTAAAERQVDLCSAVADYIRPYVNGKPGLIFHTKNGTPHLYANLEDHWLTPRLEKLGIDEKGMGWHAFRRFRNTWVRKQRVGEDYRLLWMGHAKQQMGEVYTDISDDLRGSRARGPWLRIASEPRNCSQCSQISQIEIVCTTGQIATPNCMLKRRLAKTEVLVDVTGIEPVISCLQSR